MAKKNYIVEGLVRTMNFKDQLIVRIKTRVLNWFRIKIEIFDDRKQTMPDSLREDVCAEATDDNKGEE